jgi:general secretion pathway protein C
MNHNPRMLRQRPSFVAVSALSLGRPLSGDLWVKVLTWMVWVCVAFSAVTWVLRWTAVRDVSNIASAEPQPLPEVDATALARSLGAAPLQATAAPTLASRLQLLGVLAGGPNAGAALVTVDGKPAKPYRVGAVVVDGLVLQSTQARRVTLGAAVEGPPTLTLELPVKK